MLALVIFLFISSNYFYQLSLDEKLVDSEWLEYKLENKLNFSNSEESGRKKIFSKNYAFIFESNTKNKDFTLQMNNFGHLEKNERLKLLMFNQGIRLHDNPSPIFVGKKIPFKHDWRRYKVVSPVKNQLNFNSSYAFSAIGAIESQFAIRSGFLPDLSTQEIIDCSWNYSNNGCYGRFGESVYEYCMENGISTSRMYPYCGKYFQCNRNNPNSSYKLTGYNYLTEDDEDNLLRALYYIGPISIGIDANSDEFFFYKSGVIDFSLCSSVDLNHAALAVGYSLHQRPYLLVKNSWGRKWGMYGYVKIALFRDNMCGIASDASFPIPKIKS
ncbi:hypothetical protein MXB_468 [Myxobolus squamalis]|nr:hypothetical protein MXB_468 [Myxobolus squamalis]